MGGVGLGGVDGTPGRALHYSSGNRAGIWSVAVHPGGVELAAKLVYGTRKEAEFKAHSMIDGWCLRQSKLKTATDAEQKSLDE